MAKFNGDVTSLLLERALEELEDAGVEREAVTIVPVPGAFELPLAAIALAKSRRYACIVALGCVIRGETRHFEYVAGEAASGLQLAAIETGVPVSFGVLTTDSVEQAEAGSTRPPTQIGRARNGRHLPDAPCGDPLMHPPAIHAGFWPAITRRQSPPPPHQGL